MFRKSLLAASAIAGIAAVPAAAHAAAPLSVTVPSAMPLAAVGISEAACAPLRMPAYTAPVTSQTAKSAAILGGQMSALERMKLAQSGEAAPAPAPAAAAAAPSQDITPANRTACNALGAGARIASLAVYPQARSTGRFLGTERVRIGRTRFDASWDRVSDRKLSRRDLRRAIGRTPRDRTQLLSEVNGWVNRNIAYRDDRVQYGSSDYWADARTTLRARAGDCEDYAILKMQMLAAAGVDREDMMLTVARDTIQRIDHAVLLVRVDSDGGDSWVMLDMASDRIAPAGMSYGYRPVMSFAANERFLHGQAYQAPQQQQRVRLAYN